MDRTSIMYISMVNNIKWLSLIVLISTSHLVKSQMHFADFSIPHVERGWGDLRSSLFSSLTDDKRAIESQIDYVFVESDDLNRVRAFIEGGGIRKIEVSTGFCKLLFRLVDLVLIADVFSQDDFDLYVLNDYLKDMLPRAVNDWEDPESYSLLNRDEVLSFNNRENNISRFNLYLSTLSIVLAHEVYHHLDPDHLSSDRIKGIGERLKEEKEADKFALDLLYHAEIPVYFLGIIFGTLYYELDFYNQVSNIDRSHPSGLERSLQSIGYSLMQFGAVHQFLSQENSNRNLDLQTIYRELSDYYEELLYDYISEQKLPLRYYERAASQGDADAMLISGYAYWMRYPQDDSNLETAETYFLSAAEQDNPVAQFVYGLFLFYRYGDVEQAYLYHQIAASKGMPLSRSHAVILQEIPQGRLRRYGRQFKSSISEIQNRCMVSCVNRYNYSQQECEQELCMPSITNMNSWILRFLSDLE